MSSGTMGRKRFGCGVSAKRGVLALAVVAGCAGVRAEGAVNLGSAESFAVLAATTVTNTGPSAIFGDVGVSPGTAITGFPPGMVTGGTLHSNDAVAMQAQIDATAAYVMLAALPVTQVLTGMDLGGLTLTPGVYFFSSSAQLTGTLTLDGQGLANPLFVFQIGSTLTTASASSVVGINGADGCDIFFQVGSSATLGTGTAFAGTIIATASNTLTTGASVDGRVIALNGAVTLDTNAVTHCIPAPSSVAAGLMLLAGCGARRRRVVQGV